MADIGVRGIERWPDTFLVITLLPVAAAPASMSVDLRDMDSVANTCPVGDAGTDGEIVVCARSRDPGSDRLAPPVVEVEVLPKAEFSLFGKARGKLGVGQGSVGGIPTNRVMITVTIPF